MELVWLRERVPRIDPRIHKAANRKLHLLDVAVSLNALRVPLGNRLEAGAGVVTTSGEYITCDIVAGTSPATIVAESDPALAFLTLADSALSAGHSLVVPKQHCLGVLDATSESREAVIELCSVVGRVMVEAEVGTGVNLLSACGLGSDQSVDHWRIHLVPRRSGDGVDTWPETDSPVAASDHANAGVRIASAVTIVA
ncbi:HIT domain-containing protein [Corynebacterium sp. LK2510]|uniref:HIT domain-containing protein n=1 Tax=Corynebacterium sp. LK2510 TaxID=3110472 RepID=UPI0034CFEBED